VVKVVGWVGLGICIKNLIQKNKFDFINYTQADNGSYIISSDGYTWTHQNTAQNSKTTYGFNIETGNEILFDLDLEKQILSYTNKSSKLKGSVNLLNKPKESDDLCICSCLGSGGD
jgi:hypothetical protein